MAVIINANTLLVALVGVKDCVNRVNAELVEV